MTDYYGLVWGRLATTDARLGQVLSWLRDVRPGTPNLEGRGDHADAWRHGGTAALLAYHHGYDNVKRWGDALEDYRPDNEQEHRQDIRRLPAYMVGLVPICYEEPGRAGSFNRAIRYREQGWVRGQAGDHSVSALAIRLSRSSMAAIWCFSASI